MRFSTLATLLFPTLGSCLSFTSAALAASEMVGDQKGAEKTIPEAMNFASQHSLEIAQNYFGRELRRRTQRLSTTKPGT